eukprot:jgi/Mesen1/8225/ME000443S07374
MSLRGASAYPAPKAYATEDLPERDLGRHLLPQHNTVHAKSRWRRLRATIAAAFRRPPKGTRPWWSWRGAFLLVLLVIVLLLCFHHSPGEDKGSDRSAGKEQGWNLHEKSYRESGAGGACWALQERHLYYPKSQHVPSPALLDALREYELRHQVRKIGSPRSPLPPPPPPCPALFPPLPPPASPFSPPGVVGNSLCPSH